MSIEEIMESVAEYEDMSVEEVADQLHAVPDFHIELDLSRFNRN